MSTGCASNPWPSAISPASGLWPAEPPSSPNLLSTKARRCPFCGTFLHFGCWRPLRVSSTHHLGWLSPIRSLLQFKAISHLLVVKYSLMGCLPSRSTPLGLSLLPWMHLYIKPAGFTSHRHLNCSFKLHPLLRTLKVLLHLIPVPPPQPILLSLSLGFELFNPPCLDLLPSASPLLSTLSHLWWQKGYIPIPSQPLFKICQRGSPDTV